MSQSYSLKEASAILGIPAPSLRRQMSEGQFTGFQEHIRPGSIKTEWRITQETLDYLRGKLGRPAYEEIINDWVIALRSGQFSGKPYKAKTIETNLFHMGKYWQWLNSQPDILHVTPDNLRKALASCPMTDGNDHYSMRINTYKAVRCLAKFMATKGLTALEIWDSTRNFKPRPSVQPKRHIVREDDIRKLLEFNDCWRAGRSEHNVRTLRMLLFLYGFAGLRKFEAIQLKLSDIDLKNGELYVINGKGGRTDSIPFWPELEREIRRYLEYRNTLPGVHFLLNEKLEPFKSNAIDCMFQRLKQMTGIHVTAHPLRRYCATMMDERRVPRGQIQQFMRHKDPRTTAIYINSDKRALHRIVREYGKPK